MTERELFLEFAVSRGLNVDYEVSTNGRVNFYDNRTAIAYDAWEESARREGFKFVPVEPTRTMIVAIENKVEQQLEASAITQDPFRLDGEKIFEAMIGAIDE